MTPMPPPRTLTHCPVCDNTLQVTELSCDRCATRLHGVFPAPPLARLPREHLEFIQTFVQCRGVIRDVERVLGISYPTVRARLDAAVLALDAALVRPAPSLSQVPAPPPAPVPPTPAYQSAARRAILRQVARGRMTPTEAADALAQL